MERMDLSYFEKAYCKGSYLDDDVRLIEKTTELEYRIDSKWKKITTVDFNQLEPGKFFLPVEKKEMTEDGIINLKLSDDFIEDFRKILAVDKMQKPKEIIEYLDFYDVRNFDSDNFHLSIILKNGLKYVTSPNWNMLEMLNIDEIPKAKHFIPITRRERERNVFYIDIREDFENDLLELFNIYSSQETKESVKEETSTSDDFSVVLSDMEDAEDNEDEAEKYNADNKPMPLFSVILEMVIYVFLLIQSTCVLLIEDSDIYMPIAIGSGIIIFVLSTIVTFSVVGVEKIAKGTALFSLVTFVLSILFGIISFTTGNMRIIICAIGFMHLSLSHLMYCFSTMI